MSYYSYNPAQSRSLSVLSPHRRYRQVQTCPVSQRSSSSSSPSDLTASPSVLPGRPSTTPSTGSAWSIRVCSSLESRTGDWGAQWKEWLTIHDLMTFLNYLYSNKPTNGPRRVVSLCLGGPGGLRARWKWNSALNVVFTFCGLFAHKLGAAPPSGDGGMTQKLQRCGWGEASVAPDGLSRPLRCDERGRQSGLRSSGSAAHLGAPWGRLPDGKQAEAGVLLSINRVTFLSACTVSKSWPPHTHTSACPHEILTGSRTAKPALSRWKREVEGSDGSPPPYTQNRHWINNSTKNMKHRGSRVKSGTLLFLGEKVLDLKTSFTSLKRPFSSELF